MPYPVKLMYHVFDDDDRVIAAYEDRDSAVKFCEIMNADPDFAVDLYRTTDHPTALAPDVSKLAEGYRYYQVTFRAATLEFLHSTKVARFDVPPLHPNFLHCTVFCKSHEQAKEWTLAWAAELKTKRASNGS